VELDVIQRFLYAQSHPTRHDFCRTKSWRGVCGVKSRRQGQSRHPLPRGQLRSPPAVNEWRCPYPGGHYRRALPPIRGPLSLKWVEMLRRFRRPRLGRVPCWRPVGCCGVRYLCHSPRAIKLTHKASTVPGPPTWRRGAPSSPHEGPLIPSRTHAPPPLPSPLPSPPLSSPLSPVPAPRGVPGPLSASSPVKGPPAHPPRAPLPPSFPPGRSLASLAMAHCSQGSVEPACGCREGLAVTQWHW